MNHVAMGGLWPVGARLLGAVQDVAMASGLGTAFFRFSPPPPPFLCSHTACGIVDPLRYIRTRTRILERLQGWR